MAKPRCFYHLPFSIRHQAGLFQRPVGINSAWTLPRSMARKLTSDKWLFTATLLLVCISVVMVYSASAVMAMEQHHAPYHYLFKQAAWALLGLVFVPIVMRIDYRNYRQPAVIWTMLGVVAVGAGGGAVRAAGERRVALAAARPARRAAIRARQDRHHLLHGGAARTADGSDRRDRLLAAADRDHRRRDRRADPARAGSWHRRYGPDDRRGRWCLRPASTTRYLLGLFADRGPGRAIW